MFATQHVFRCPHEKPLISTLRLDVGKTPAPQFTQPQWLRPFQAPHRSTEEGVQ